MARPPKYKTEEERRAAQKKQAREHAARKRAVDVVKARELTAFDGESARGES